MIVVHDAVRRWLLESMRYQKPPFDEAVDALSVIGDYLGYIPQLWLDTIEFMYFRDTYRMDIMPRKKSTESATNEVRYKGYVNVYLTDEQVDEFTGSYAPRIKNPFQLVAGWIDAGFKLTVGMKDQGATVYVSAMDMRPDSPSAGYILSSFAPDLQQALALLAYKHEVVLKGVWSTEKKTKRNFG